MAAARRKRGNTRACLIAFPSCRGEPPPLHWSRSFDTSARPEELEEKPAKRMNQREPLRVRRTGSFFCPQSGATAVTSISTLARSSISAETSTAVMAALKLPMISRKALPISG